MGLQKLNGQASKAAYLTHYLHSLNSGHKKYYEQQALEYAKELGIKSDLNKIKFDIPFPPSQKTNFTFIDLFAGIGGFRIAAQEKGGRCVFSSEWDKFAQRTYERNFGELPFGDITQIDAKHIPEHDVLFAGFPCQPFSYSGLNEGFKDKTRGTLFFDIVRILEEKQPKMFLLENVKGLKSHEGGKTLKTIENTLIKLGYDIHWKVLRSYDFGLPQMRERWYCVGSLKKIPFEFPKGSDSQPKLKDIVDKKDKNKSLQLSDFEKGRIRFHFENMSDEVERVEHDSSKYKPHTKKGKHGVFSFQKKDGSLRFHVGDRAKTQIQEAFYCTLDSYAPTIIANRVPKLWDIERRLSVIESQRLQGFPDEFLFPVSDNQAYKQLGNSVSVPVIENILKNMVNYL
jgi:DNA (cytosine-5)-methyltransferase 1